MKIPLSGVVKNLGGAVTSAADAAKTAVNTSLVDAKSCADKAKQVGAEFGQATSCAVGGIKGAVSNLASRLEDSVRSGTAIAGESAASGAKLAGAALGAAAGSAGNAIGAAALLVGDLNGDGKVDFEDAKIAAAKVKDVAGAAAAELGQLGKNVLQSKLVQDAAAGAIVGGVLASGIPFVGTATGATVGAALGVYKGIGTK